ncbi:hypothetical protein DV515_00017348 [Chloebia gouldiae]|uniref:Uncharacterized protein n=1 Tax=Chloebia gouldiae TaxID=44316 RepID=A0A3L8QVX3_CHLGU|nr:hypothetical protein DV515_00017348 [Chloebia gouldiae]
MEVFPTGGPVLAHAQSTSVHSSCSQPALSCWKTSGMPQEIPGKGTRGAVLGLSLFGILGDFGSSAQSN